MSHIFDLTQPGETEDFLNFNFVSKAQQQEHDMDHEPPKTSRGPGRPKARASIAAPKRRAAPDLSFDLPPDLNLDFDDDLPPSSNNNYKKIPLKQVQEHQNLTNQLNGYAASVRFRPVIDQCGIKIKDLHTKSVAELKELRERVRACCASSGGTTGILAQTTLAGCSSLEKWMPKKVCDLDGYRKTVESNPEFHKLAEMIELDSGFAASMTPMQRMALCLGGAAMSVAAENAKKQMIQSAQERLVSNLIAQRDAQARVAQSSPSSTSIAQDSPDIVRAEAAPKPAPQPTFSKPTNANTMYD